MSIREHDRLYSTTTTQRVVDFIQAHLTQDLSLDALAQHSGFSAYHFARLFRRTTGESPHRFVLRQRVEHAQALLEQPDLSLAEVALATGFAHQSHLTQQFKRHFGVTPSAYRREHGLARADQGV
jgi:AraC family transcriptional regulator